MENRRDVYFYDVCVYNDFLYFVSIFHDGFFCFDLNTRELKYLGDSDMDDRNSYLNIRVKKIDQSIFSVPYFGNCLFEYDLNKKTLFRHGINLSQNKQEVLKRAFQNIYKFNGKYYLIPRSYSAIVELDSLTKEVILEYGDWYKEFSDLDRLWIIDEVLVDSSVYMVQAWSNRILEYDLAEHRYAIYHIGETEDEFSFIKHDGENFWLFCRNKLRIIQWNKEKNFIRIFDKFSREFKNAMVGNLEHENIDDILSSVYIDAGFIYLVSALNPIVLQVNMENMNCNLIYLNDIRMPKHIEWVLPFAVSGMNEKNIYCMTSDGTLFIYDKRWRKTSEIKMIGSFEYDYVSRKHIHKALSKGEKLYEKELRWGGNDLKDGIHEMLEWKPMKIPSGTMNCGNKILRTILSEQNT